MEKSVMRNINIILNTANAVSVWITKHK